MLLTPPPEIPLADATMRPWSISDAPLLRAALTASDAHLRAWTPWVVDGRVPGMSLEDRLAKHVADFAAGTEWMYGIFSPDEAEVLGACGLFARVGPDAVELGYWLGVGHTGRGLATRSAAALTRVAFTGPTIDRVEIHCDRRNTASTRVPERLQYRLKTETAGPDEIVVWELSRAEFNERF